MTLDAEFGNPLLFHAREFRGIVLLRLPGRASRQSLTTCLETLAAAFRESETPPESPDARLWIVQPGRLRVYEPDEDLPLREGEEEYPLPPEGPPHQGTEP